MLMRNRHPFASPWATLCALFLALLVATPVGAEAPTLVGVWLHPNKRIQVEIVPCGDRLCGHIVWFKWPNDPEGTPLTDQQNLPLPT